MILVKGGGVHYREYFCPLKLKLSIFRVSNYLLLLFLLFQILYVQKWDDI